MLSIKIQAIPTFILVLPLLIFIVKKALFSVSLEGLVDWAAYSVKVIIGAFPLILTGEDHSRRPFGCVAKGILVVKKKNSHKSQ